MFVHYKSRGRGGSSSSPADHLSSVQKKLFQSNQDNDGLSSGGGNKSAAASSSSNKRASLDSDGSPHKIGRGGSSSSPEL